MKRYKSKEYEKDCRICGDFNNAPLQIARAVTNKVLERETSHSHKGYEFYLFIRGKAEIEVNGEIISVEKGDVILVEPGEKHKMVNIIEETDYITIKDLSA